MTPWIATNLLTMPSSVVRLASLMLAAAAITAVMVSRLSAQTPATVTYNASTACVAHVQYTNDVLPPGVGEFSAHGLNRAFWGGKKSRSLAPVATWGPGFMTSWGRHQYDTYFGDSSDGLGYDPFAVMADTAAPGSPNALRIEAMPLPAPIAHSWAVLANDQWPVAKPTAPFVVPPEGGTITAYVDNPNGAHDDWTVGIGYAGARVAFIGTLKSGGATPDGTGGANPWTITNVHVITGAPGTTIRPGANDAGGFRAYNFPAYYSGVLDTNVNQQYGLFVARLRLPPYLPALSPAFWTLATGGVPRMNGELNRDELDIAEMFANSVGNSLNANQILWQQKKAAQGRGIYPFPDGRPQTDYHDYAVLVTPQGTSFYLDGRPIVGNVNIPDGTQGSSDKEVMLMFQVDHPGSWLDPKGVAASNPWPQYFWAQWIRIYRPTSANC